MVIKEKHCFVPVLIGNKNIIFLHHRTIADVLADALHDLDEDYSEEESYHSSEDTDIDNLNNLE